MQFRAFASAPTAFPTASADESKSSTSHHFGEAFTKLEEIELEERVGRTLLTDHQAIDGILTPFGGADFAKRRSETG